MNQFSKRKFQSLLPRRQHRHCAHELLARYRECLEGRAPSLSAYEELLSWMEDQNLPDLQPDVKQISDRYHFHLQKADWHLREDGLLVKTQDTPSDTPFLPIAIYLDHLRSAHNVGSILRTCEALRIGSVHVSEQTPSHTHRQTIKASMGTSSIVPCFCNTPLAELPRPWIALETVSDAIPIEEFFFPPSFTLILGNEERGISNALLQETNLFLKIPLFGYKNSLNVACAFAIAAHAIRTQIPLPLKP